MHAYTPQDKRRCTRVPTLSYQVRLLDDVSLRSMAPHLTRVRDLRMGYCPAVSDEVRPSLRLGGCPAMLDGMLT